MLNSKSQEITKPDVGKSTELPKVPSTLLSQISKEEENSTHLKPPEELKNLTSSMTSSEFSRLKLENYKITLTNFELKNII